MPDISKLSKYLKAEEVKDGDVITFLDPGTIEVKEFKKNDGEVEKKEVFEILVSINGNKKLYSPNVTTRKLLAKAWGNCTEHWVTKKAKITVVPSNNGKDMIIAKPLDAREAAQERNPKVSEEVEF